MSGNSLPPYFSTFAGVKKFSAIFLFSIYLFSVTDVKELLKIKVLVQHFVETRNSDHAVGFFDFIVMHYVTDDQNTRDDETDARLPFKSHNLGDTNFSWVFVSPGFVTVAPPSFTMKEIEWCMVLHPIPVFQFPAPVWRPPQSS